MQYIYVLKLIERLVHEEGWTATDKSIVSRHFEKLVALKESGKLVLAGRTTHEGEDSFGIVILDTEEDDARKLMNEDPAVAEGIMTAELFPYRVALISEENVSKG